MSRSLVRTRFVFAVTSLVCTLTFSPGQASVAVSPARLEVEVGTEGTDAQLTFVNRGDRPVSIQVYPGLGSQRPDGAPIYRDAPALVRETAQWVVVERERFSVAPGSISRLNLRFLPVPQAVAAYPVLFAEIQEQDDSQVTAIGHSAVKSVRRLAIPALVTFAATRGKRRPESEVVSVAARPIPGTSELDLDVVARNIGNVHGWVRGRIRSFDDAGHLLDTILLPEERVLPGVTRLFRARWDSGFLRRPVRFVAEVYGDGWTSSLVPLALNAPVELWESDGALRVARLGAQWTPGGGSLDVSGAWLFTGDIAADVTARIEVYDVFGEIVVTHTPKGTIRLQPKRSGRIDMSVPVLGSQGPVSVAVHLMEGEVSKAYAATTLSVLSVPSVPAVADRGKQTEQAVLFLSSP